VTDLQSEPTTRFAEGVAAMPVRGGTVARERMLTRLGVVLLIAGPVLGVLAYTLSHGTENALQQRDAITLGLLGVSISVVGLAVFLRYSLGGILRLWLARAVAEKG
jgi:hypothetical protein